MTAGSFTRHQPYFIWGRNFAEDGRIVNEIIRRETTSPTGMGTLGNTAGTTGPVNGSVLFVGSNNITLSQSLDARSQNATVSILGATGTSATGSNTLGMSNLGNTSGTSGVISGSALQYLFAGGNNITLSQSINGQSATLTISAGAGGGAAGTNTLGISNLGNTSGTSGVITGSALQFILAGGNNITLSQSVNGSSATVTISAFNQTVQTQNLHNVTLSGNTSGVLAAISSGTMTLAGGNNITLSQAGNAVTISAFNQTVQTQNLFNLTLSGNTSGALAGVSSGTMTLAGGNNITLSQAGNAVTISAFSQTVQTQNLHNVTISGNTSGALAAISSGTMTLAGGNNITLSQAGNAISISAAAQTSSWATNSFWYPQQGGSRNTVQGINGSVSVFPSPPVFGYISGSRGDIQASLSLSSSSNSSHAGDISVYIGLYTRNASTLSLASSGSQSYRFSNTSNNSFASLTDIRRFSVPINFNVTPGDYWIGVMSRTASTNTNWFTGRVVVHSDQFTNVLQGLIGEATSASRQMLPGWGVFSATSTAMPSSMAFTNISGIGSAATVHHHPAVVFAGMTA